MLLNFQYKDHPRACGENAQTILGKRIDLGSPPRMRGKLKKGAEELVGERITPAHAGKTPVYQHSAH